MMSSDLADYVGNVLTPAERLGIMISEEKPIGHVRPQSPACDQVFEQSGNAVLEFLLPSYFEWPTAVVLNKHCGDTQHRRTKCNFDFFVSPSFSDDPRKCSEGSSMIPGDPAAICSLRTEHYGAVAIPLSRTYHLYQTYHHRNHKVYKFVQ